MLKEKILQNLNTALKEKKELELSVLRMLSAAVQNRESEKRTKLWKEKADLPSEELEKKSKLTDEEVLEVISSEAKKRKESIEGFQKGKREDLVEKEKKELEILESYLPEQLSEEEIKKLVQETVSKVGAKEMRDVGKVMQELMPEVKGRADGALVSKIAKESLEA